MGLETIEIVNVLPKLDILFNYQGSKMKEIITLCGKSNVGKTTIINMLIKALIGGYKDIESIEGFELIALWQAENADHETHQKDQKNDNLIERCATFKYTGEDSNTGMLFIGICTAGDLADQIKENFEWFEGNGTSFKESITIPLTNNDYRCAIGITAIRTGRRETKKTPSTPEAELILTAKKYETDVIRVGKIKVIERMENSLNTYYKDLLFKILLISIENLQKNN